MLTNATTPDIDSATLTITLTETQRQSAVIINTGDDSPVRININATAIKDVSGNAFFGIHNATLTITNDATPPTLKGNPTLNLVASTLTFTFNEIIDVSATTSTGITISETVEDGTVTLDTTTMLSDTDSATITITLTSDQVSLISDLSFTDENPLQITITNATFADLTGNKFVGINNDMLTVIAFAPSLDDTPPILDLHAGTISFDFDVMMDVTTVDLSKITITDQSDGNGVTLGGTMLPVNNTDVVILSLTEAQRQAVTLLQHGTNTTPLQVDINASAFKDTDGNSFAGANNVELTVTRILPTGEPWVLQNSGTTTRLLGVHFIDENNGWVVGNGGIMRSTVNGGETWSNVDTIINTTLRNVYFFNSTVGWIAGDPFDIGNDGTTDGIIHYTDDGAQSWDISTPRLRSVNIFDIHFINSTHGWAAGNGGTVLVTTNSGTTWNNQQSGIDSSLREINFVDSNRGWVVGASGTIIVTTNGGTTWSNQTSGVSTTLNDVVFINSNRGWAVGANGTVIVTTNGGTTWSNQTSGVNTTFTGVQFVDLEHGWAVGNGGTIIYTSNGGDTWSTQNTPTNNTLRDIHFTDSGHGWAIGDNGTVLRGIYSDTAPPLLTNAMPKLDVLTRTLSLTFDKTIDVSATNLDGISITGDASSGTVTLTGAEVPNTNSNTLVITMTPTQIQPFNDLTSNDASPLHVTVTETAVADLAGNNFAGITDARLAVTGDVTPPVLTDTTPNLDLVASTLSFEFSEPIDVSKINLDGIIISNATGSNTVALTDATPPSVVSNIVTLGLTEAQVVSLKELIFDDAAPLQMMFLKLH